MQENEIIRTRESALSLAFWIKLALTLGLYFIWWRNKSLTVTNKLIIVKKGLLRKTERSIPLKHVLEARVSSGMIGRMLGYGDIQIQTAAYGAHNLSELTLRNLAKAKKVRDAIVSAQQ